MCLKSEKLLGLCVCVFRFNDHLSLNLIMAMLYHNAYNIYAPIHNVSKGNLQLFTKIIINTNTTNKCYICVQLNYCVINNWVLNILNVT